MTTSLPRTKEVVTLDFPETAPASGKPRMYLDDDGKLLPRHRAGAWAAGLGGGTGAGAGRGLVAQAARARRLRAAKRRAKRRIPSFKTNFGDFWRKSGLFPRLTGFPRTNSFRASLRVADAAWSTSKGSVMKVRNSLRSLKKRDKDCRVIRRKGRVYVINKKNPRFKARQG